MEQLGNMPLGLALTILGLALCFAIPPVIILGVRARKRSRCTVRTMGTIIGWQTRRDSESVSFHPIYEYEANGSMQQIASNYSSTSFNKKYPVGSRLELFFDPSKPQSFYVPEEDDGISFLVRIFFGIALLLVIILGVTAFFYARG